MLRLATTGHYGGRPLPRGAAPRLACDGPLALCLHSRRILWLPRCRESATPSAFPDLFAAPAPSTRALVRELSPLYRIGDVLAPVELLVSPTDRYFPPRSADPSRVSGRDVRLTVMDGLDHVQPRLGLHLLPVLAALERTLRRAAACAATSERHRQGTGSSLSRPGKDRVPFPTRIRVLSTR